MENVKATKSQAYKETLQRGTVVFPIQYSLCNTANPNYDLPLHWHDEFEIIHMISGSYRIFTGMGEFLLEEGDICLIPGDVVHGDAQERGIALYESVVFDMDLIRLHSYSPDIFFNDMLNGGISLVPVIGAGEEEIRNCASRFFSTIKLQREELDLLSVGLLMEFFGLIKKNRLFSEPQSPSSHSAKDARMNQISSVLNLIRNEYGKDISLDRMAGVAALSPKYFCRLFRESTGHTPIEYLNWFRVNRACTLLRETDGKLLDIALECGFNDFSYFTKTFRRYKGIPPSKYRAALF